MLPSPSFFRFCRGLPFALAAALSCMPLVLTNTARADNHHWDQLTFEQIDGVAEVVLTQAQALSLANNREYCGYIAFNAADKLQFTAPIRGDIESCEPPVVPDSWELIASYHTHGALDPAEPDANFELPSSDDLISDSEEGVDGYLSTPGGRFWFIDTVDELVILLGDTGYFEPDQLFVEDIDCPLQAEYSFEDIFVMEDEELAACEL